MEGLSAVMAPCPIPTRKLMAPVFSERAGLSPVLDQAWPQIEKRYVFPGMTPVTTCHRPPKKLPPGSVEEARNCCALVPSLTRRASCEVVACLNCGVRRPHPSPGALHCTQSRAFPSEPNDSRPG